MAPSKKIFLAVLEKLEGFMKWNATIRGDSIVDDSKATEDQVDDEVENTDVHVELIEFPCDTGIFGTVMFICLFPLRFIMHWTLPDVRQMDCHGDTNTGINTALFATFMCLVWLVIGSYAMVASLESLAELMDIPDAVIGFTVSAAGKKLPIRLDMDDTLIGISNLQSLRYFASKLCRKQGGSRKWVWEPSRFQCVWEQYIQYHGRIGFALDALHQLWNWFPAVPWSSS